MEEYDHKQKAPLWWFLLIPGGLLLLASLYPDLKTFLRIVFVSTGALLIFLSLCFQYLNIQDQGNSLNLKYGPIPLFSKSFPYENIENIHTDQIRFIDGWGIHWIPGRGWTFNLWGWDCVSFTMNQTRYRIGTDQPEELAEFLAGKTSRNN